MKFSWKTSHRDMFRFRGLMSLICWSAHITKWSSTLVRTVIIPCNFHHRLKTLQKVEVLYLNSPSPNRIVSPRVCPPHQLALIWSRHLKIPSSSHVAHVLFLFPLALPLHDRPGDMAAWQLEMSSEEAERTSPWRCSESLWKWAKRLRQRNKSLVSGCCASAEKKQTDPADFHFWRV